MQRYFVAFYRGSGRFEDWLVRRVTRSAFSHVELIRADRRPRLGDEVTCLGASGRDGGVRIKRITLEPAHWRIYEVRWAREETWDRAASKLGQPYELWSMITTQLFNFRRSKRNCWFCSELVAYALGLSMPHAYAPGDLLRTIHDHDDTFSAAHAAMRPLRGIAAAAITDDDAPGLSV